MSKVSARWVPRMLTDDQKRTLLDISRYLLSRYEDDPVNFIERVVTQDLTWIQHFDPESKMQSKQSKYPGSSPPKKFKRVHSAGKVVASILWNIQGVIMIDYFVQGRRINGAYEAGKLRRLRHEIARKRRGKLICIVLLLQDNAYAHTSQVDMTVATECGFEFLPHPPYSHDVAPSDLYMFPKLKSHVRGTQYGSNEGVTEAVNEYLWDQEKASCFKRIRKLEQKWAKSIALKGDYIEK